MTPIYSYQIGTALGSMTNLESLTTPVSPPKSKPKFYEEALDLGDSTVRGGGRPSVVWHWDFLTQAQRDQLRTFCTGASANIYIKSRGLDSTSAYMCYSAVMIWPIEEERVATKRLDFNIEFRNLVAQTCP